MITKAIEKINRENLRKNALPEFRIGDTVTVQVKIKEGEKERIQSYTGLVIARDGGSSTETFTVRKNSHGVGVERVFPVHSPHVAGLKVESSGHVRRAKLYYLRERSGKTAKLREKNKAMTAAVSAPTPA
jgi:large subunit ribosomal protein L19